ncbi:ABC transporter permease [Pontibacter silvestris]|uniref:ABC transporter permease n=1 Tax=Pontibacter silvestris TaxID=2305183 RepID=A0ABW4WTF9_9BACT|nr:ABC transporter permease [Pontibacter silvestris]MCC9137973.1 ABC transporter permease [Pontibacter silvestris]
MHYYLLKRFITALPTLWLLISLVFLLSRMLPGSFSSARILDDNAGFYSKANAESREKAYRDYLHKTSQDLPLFYFSINAAPEPDSLNLKYSESDRQQLKRLAWHYGSQNIVSEYFNNLQQVENQLSSNKKQRLQNELMVLHTSISSHDLVSSAQKVAEASSTTAASALEKKTIQLVKQQNPYSFMLPALHWHGLKNQYHQWLSQLLQGNFGYSYRNNRAVTEVLAEAIGNTWWLISISICLAFIIALELSLLMIQHPHSRWKKFTLSILFTLDSIPLFVLALLLLVLFASPFFLQLFPVYGMGFYGSEPNNIFYAIANQAPFMVLPIVCLVLSVLPYLTNQIYRALSDAAQANYTKTARAKGLSFRKIVRTHILRNALLPIITLLSDMLPSLAAGAIIVETIFAIPGIGSMAITAVQSRDYPVIVAIVLVIAIFKVLSNLLADFCYALADPRIRYSTS